MTSPTPSTPSPSRSVEPVAAELDRLRAVEAAAREVVALMLTSGQEPPPLNDYGLLSMLMYHATREATSYEGRARQLATALTVLRSDLAATPPRCGCTADTELGAGSGCTVCRHRDHGASGCRAALTQP